jgi:hypothetical protein
MRSLVMVRIYIYYNTVDNCLPLSPYRSLLRMSGFVKLPHFNAPLGNAELPKTSTYELGPSSHL